jgi:hypothetical protein
MKDATQHEVSSGEQSWRIKEKASRGATIRPGLVFAWQLVQPRAFDVCLSNVLFVHFVLLFRRRMSLLSGAKVNCKPRQKDGLQAGKPVSGGKCLCHLFVFTWFTIWYHGAPDLQLRQGAELGA